MAEELGNVSKRLEALRSYRGIPTVKEFWRQAVEAGGFAGSYASAATYHKDREAPFEYVAAASIAFGARLEWLVLGVGPMTNLEAEEQRKRELAEGTLAERVLGSDPRYEELLRSGVRDLLELVVSRLWESEPERCTSADFTPEDLCRDVAALLLLPTKLWGFAELGYDLRTHRYLVGMLNALETLIHEPRDGQPAADYAKSPIRRVRKLAES